MSAMSKTRAQTQAQKYKNIVSDCNKNLDCHKIWKTYIPVWGLTLLLPLAYRYALSQHGFICKDIECLIKLLDFSEIRVKKGIKTIFVHGQLTSCNRLMNLSCMSSLVATCIQYRKLMFFVVHMIYDMFYLLHCYSGSGQKHFSQYLFWKDLTVTTEFNLTLLEM